MSSKRVQNKGFVDFFIKQKFGANRQNGFYSSRLPKNEEIGDIFVFSGSELSSLFKNSKSKLKNWKH